MDESSSEEGPEQATEAGGPKSISNDSSARGETDVFGRNRDGGARSRSLRLEGDEGKRKPLCVGGGMRP